MAGVDTSSYPTAASMAAQQQANNPLTMLTSLAGLQHAGLQNQLINRTMSSQQAVGRAVQAATGADGVVDTNAAGTAIAGNPDAAFGAPQAFADLQAQRQAQLAEHTSRVDLALKQNGFMTNSLGALADKQGVTGKDVSDLAGTLVANGILDPKMAATELSAMPADPTQIPAYLRTLQMRSQTAAQQILDFHNQVMVNNGQQTVPVNMAPLATPPAPIQMKPTPEFEASPREVLLPNGQTGAITQHQFEQQAAGGTPVPTALSPGQHAAATTTGAGHAQAAVQFENTTNTVPQSLALLKNIKSDNDILNTGPGSAGRNSFVSSINSILGTNYGAKDVATRDDLDHVSTQLQAKLRDQFGLPATNQSSSIMDKAAPNGNVSRLGNENLVANIKGQLQYAQGLRKFWETTKSHGAGGDDFNTVMGIASKTLDPLTFQMPNMSANQQAQLTKSLSTEERKALARSNVFAQKNHLLP